MLTENYKKLFKKSIDELKAESAVRIVFITEIVDYTVGLNEIINSALDENKKIEDLASKIDAFLNAAEKNSAVAGPYAPIIAGSAEVGKIANDLIKHGRIIAKNIRTLKSLDKAVEVAGPIFEKIATTFKADLVALSKINATLGETFLGAYRKSHETEFEYRTALIEHRNVIIDTMLEYGNNKKGEFLALYAARDGVWGGKRNYDILQSIHKQLDLSKEIFSQYERERAEGRSKIATTNQLIIKTDKTLDALGKAHKELAQALKKGVSVDFTMLAAYVKQLIELQEQLRKL